MRLGTILCVALALCGLSTPPQRKRDAWPSGFVLAKHLYFDFGPPFDFYELYIVQRTQRGTSLERITLTPPGDACIAPARVDVASAMLKETVAEILGPRNACAVPVSELSARPKPCKNCMRFSGADVVIQVRCGAETRSAQSDILGQYLYGTANNAPQGALWTMQLLKRLDEAVGPGPEDRRIFPLPPSPRPSVNRPRSEVLRELAAGRFDYLFRGDPEKPSSLYKAAQKVPPAPTVRLVRSLPFAPLAAPMPTYPPIARLAHIEGAVTFRAKIGPGGHATGLAFVSGNPLLRYAVKKAVAGWSFPGKDASKSFEATIAFAPNCPR